MNDLHEIRSRLERLEKTNRRWRGVALAALGLAVFAVCVGIVQSGHAQQIIQPGRKPEVRLPKPIVETIAARTVVLCDGLDKPRLVLSAEGVALFDNRTKPRLVLSENGLLFQDDELTPRTALTPDRLAIYHNGGAEFTRVDADGFILTDGRDQVRACLKADNRGSFLHLGDRQNRILFGSDDVLAALQSANIRIIEIRPQLVFVSVKLR